MIATQEGIGFTRGKRLERLLKENSNGRPLRTELVHRARRYLGSTEDAEDAVQDVMTTMLRGALDLYDTNRPFKPWISEALRNRCRDLLRRKMRKNHINIAVDVDDETFDPTYLLPIDSLRPEDHLVEIENRMLLRYDVESLPEPYRRMVKARHYLGEDYATIAGQEQIPLGTVKSRLHWALTMLRKKEMDRQTFYET